VSVHRSLENQRQVVKTPIVHDSTKTLQTDSAAADAGMMVCVWAHIVCTIHSTTTLPVAPEPAMTSPGRPAGYGPLSAVRRRAERPVLEETGRQAVYCKHTAPGCPNRLTCAVTVVSNSCSTSPIHTYNLHTLGFLCNGPIWPGLSTDHRLSYLPLLLWSLPTVQSTTIGGGWLIDWLSKA